MHQNHEPAFRQLVGPAHATVIVVAMRFHRRVKIGAQLGDLPPTEVLVAAVVVQPKHGRKPSPHPLGLQHNRFRRRPVRKLPAQMLDMKPIVVKLMLDLGFRRLARSVVEASNREPARARRCATHQARRREFARPEMTAAPALPRPTPPPKGHKPRACWVPFGLQSRLIQSTYLR